MPTSIDDAAATTGQDASARGSGSKAACIARLTQMLMEGHILTTKSARAKLEVTTSERQVAGWLREISVALGEQIVCEERSVNDGRRPVKCYRHADRSPAFDDVRGAISGLRTAQQLAGHLEETGLFDALRAADTTLTQQLPGESTVEPTRHVLLRPQLPALDPRVVGHVDQLLNAIRKRRRTKLDYRTRDGESKTYTFDPWSFIDHGRGLYIFGRVIRSPNVLRCFDLASIEAVRVTRNASVRPDDCEREFRAYRRHRFGLWVDESKAVDVVLEARGKALDFLTRRPLAHGQQVGSVSADGWSRLSARLAVDPELMGYLLMLAPHVRVLEPLDFAKQHRRILEAALGVNRRI